MSGYVVWTSESEGYDPRCPACGDPIDYCQGHGVMGDPEGFVILALHDEGDHSRCHERGCDERMPAGMGAWRS